MARTKGAKNAPKIVNTVDPSRCRVCQSTRREDYEKKTVQDLSGERDGQPYNRIVYRPTRCLDCGQSRVDRTFEFEPSPADLDRLDESGEL
jgi:hypothetical protein